MLIRVPVPTAVKVPAWALVNVTAPPAKETAAARALPPIGKETRALLPNGETITITGTASARIMARWETPRLSDLMSSAISRLETSWKFTIRPPLPPEPTHEPPPFLAQHRDGNPHRDFCHAEASRSIAGAAISFASRSAATLLQQGPVDGGAGRNRPTPYFLTTEAQRHRGNISN